jgi:hypothetical protein
MLRRLVTALAALPLLATVGLLSAASPAAAANTHWVSGTYQLFIQGYGTQTLALLDDHTVGPPPNSGTWAAEKPKHEVTVNVAGGQAPPTDCLRAGQGPVCYFSDQYSGPKTPTGIASQADPGVANAYLGGELLLSEPCWAVRTGTVRIGKT